MTKQKVGVVTACIVGAAFLLGGGYLLGRGHLFATNKNFDAAAADYSNTTDSSAASGSSGLSVSSSGASNLGQLGASNGQNPAGGSTGNSSSGSSGSSTLDPSTFAQYDKYKDNNQALFGEIQKGTGDTLTSGKQASVYYKGWLTNGQMFDESRTGSDGKQQPFSFTLGSHQVIPGFEQGVAGMQVGGTRLLIIPPSVGYGSQAQSGIPPNSVLVFEVQLLSVQ